MIDRDWAFLYSRSHHLVNEMTIAEIKRIRKKLKWSYEKFAEEAGIHYNTVYRWENGKFKPSQLALRQMENLKQTLIAKRLLKGKRK